MEKSSMTKKKFLNQWLRHFARGLSKKDFETYVQDQYIWHVFSFPLLEYSNLLTGDAAREAFDKVDKSGCICCDMFGTEGVTCMTAFDSVTAAEIDSHYKEYYVVASDDSWTYIRTHEDGLCGPYFLKLK